jgi:hypothetical protein
MNEIIDLQEVFPNNWKAKYQGNYGVYTIHVTFDKQGLLSDYSCSCPSSYSPCKHIDVVRHEIENCMMENQNLAVINENKSTVEEILKHVSFQELHDFVVRQAKYNSDLTNSIHLAFAHKLVKGNVNPYSSIIYDILKHEHFDYEDYEDEESFDLEGLFQWIKKAQEYVEQKNHSEALLISNACIEEFAQWLQDEDEEVMDYISSDYQSLPFDIMKQAAKSNEINKKELYDYCLSEMNNSKYKDAGMFDSFNDLLAILSVEINPNKFIALQDSLLEKVEDKSSSSAETILQRKIDFYNHLQQSEKAKELIEQNIQIENFRYQIAKQRFEEQNYTEAKRLIDELLSSQEDQGRYFHGRWKELLLTIAQKENDIPAIRTIAFSFIKQHFNKQYFDIYKSAFTPDEWKVALEDIIQHYEKNSRDSFPLYKKPPYFKDDIADVLLVENKTERLMDYIEKNLTAEGIKKYHTGFVDLYPEKTLELYKKAVDNYVAVNLGRNHYEYVAGMLKQMRNIENGGKVVSEMIAHYRIVYKKRSAMMEILNSL